MPCRSCSAIVRPWFGPMNRSAGDDIELCVDAKATSPSDRSHNCALPLQRNAGGVAAAGRADDQDARAYDGASTISAPTRATPSPAHDTDRFARRPTRSFSKRPPGGRQPCAGRGRPVGDLDTVSTGPTGGEARRGSGREGSDRYRRFGRGGRRRPAGGPAARPRDEHRPRVRGRRRRSRGGVRVGVRWWDRDARGGRGGPLRAERRRDRGARPDRRRAPGLYSRRAAHRTRRARRGDLSPGAGAAGRRGRGRGPWDADGFVARRWVR